jgi:cytochrome P450
LHPKIEQPVEFVKFWNLWGPTISSVDGDEWKAHRKAVSAGFGSAMNARVWEEAQHQTESLAIHWLESDTDVLPDIRKWTSKLALHVISSGFFNRRLEWNNQGTAKEVPPGHEWTFDKALFTILDRLAVIFMTPRAMLGKFPGQASHEAYMAYTEMTNYLEELQASVTDDMQALASKRNKTILGKSETI